MNSDVAEPINLGSSDLVTIDQLVDIAEQIAGIRLMRRYDRGAPTGVNGRNSDNSMILDRLGWGTSRFGFVPASKKLIDGSRAR